MRATMEQQAVIHDTFVIERNYPKPPARVFAAFSDSKQKRRWFAEGKSHEVEEFQMDFRVGGSEHAQYWMNETTPFPGVTLIHDAIIQDIVPDKRVVSASTMSLGDRRISASLVTIELLEADGGTRLVCTHQGTFFEGSDGPKMREAGWNRLFDQLGKEVA